MIWSSTYTNMCIGYASITNKPPNISGLTQWRCLSHSRHNLMQVAWPFCADLSKWRFREPGCFHLKLCFHFQPKIFNIPLILSCFQSIMTYYFCSYSVSENHTTPPKCTEAMRYWGAMNFWWILTFTDSLREDEQALDCHITSYFEIYREYQCLHKLILSTMSDT